MSQESQGTLESLAQELAKLFSPLEERLQDDGVLYLMADLGIQFPDTLLNNNSFQSAVTSVANAASELPELIDLLISGIETDDTPKIGQAVGSILETISTLVNSIDTVANTLQSAASPFGSVTQAEIDQFVADLPVSLVEFLIIRYLEDNYHTLEGLLELVGIVERQELQIDSSDTAKPPYVRRKFHFDRIGKLFDSPDELFQDVYKWGGTDLESDLFLQNIGRLLGGFGVPWYIQPLGFGEPHNMLRFGPFRVIPRKDVPPNELEVQIIQQIASDFNVSLPFFIEGWTFTFGVTGELETGVGMTITPLFNISFAPVAAKANSGVNVGLTGQGQDGQPYYLVGQPGGSRVQAGQIKITTGASLLYDAVADKSEGNYFIEAAIEDGKIVITASGGDGFLNEILAQINLESNFDIRAGIDYATGFYFEGSSTLEINLPVHVEIAGLELQNIIISIGFESGSVPLELGVSLKAQLGPLAAVVENLGVSVDFTFPPNNSGNLGPIDASLGFKPPNGVGLSLDAGAVKGGGYLYFDFDREEYAGALELVFSEWIALKAIGLITTKMPDGSKGFSLLIIITVEFGSGIQLGFGFTLLGVGGLLGLNRIVKVEPLREGVRTGAIESVMFPEDVIANAPRIISDLRRFFPPQPEIFLVGPMAKIGWGTPTLVNITIGIIFEFPSVNITILGVLKVILPDENADILRLQVNFLGRIEPSNQLLWFYAFLFDSRVLFITLEGGMGLYVNWGDNANFVVSVGGFHPRYNPPPLPFSEPPRIAVTILNESYAKVRIEGYFAVTSNSVQFGAKAELFFGVSEFNIEGFLGFDALFQFDPFFFSFGLSISLSVTVFGIGLFSVGFSGLLEGPTPWHIEGKGSISLLFFSISVPFEHTWGESQDTKLDPIDVFPLLESEFEALTNWEARLPDSSNILVSLRKLGESESDQLVLHPVGKLRVSQRKVPINFKLDKIGNQRPADVIQVDVDATLPGSSLSVSKVKEKFAIGQFKELDGSTQLSSPAFEPLEGGLEIAVAGEQMKTSRAVRRVIRYETIIIDNNFKRHVKSFFEFFITGYAVLNAFLFAHFLTGSAVKKSVLSQHHKKRLQPFDEVIQVQPMYYSVVSNTDNRPIDAGATTFTSQAQALDHMEQQIQTDATLANRLHVIPNTELNLTP